MSPKPAQKKPSPSGKLHSMQKQMGNQSRMRQMNTRCFSMEEDQMLRQLVERYGEKNWNLIAKFLPMRAPRECKERWMKFLSEPTKEWTDYEKIRLIEMVAQNGEKWEKISDCLGRSLVSCRNTFKQLIEQDVYKNLFNESLPRDRKATKRFDAKFNRKRGTDRVGTMYGMINGKLQGPHTIPFVLIDAFINHNEYDTLLPLIATPEEFVAICQNEEIELDKDEIDNYQQLYQRMQQAAEQGEEWGDVCQYIYPGNISMLGWKEAMKYMINQHPYATYHWRDKIDVHSTEGHAMMKGKGTEGPAAWVYCEGELTEDLFLACIDGLDNAQNQYISQEAFEKYLEKWKQAILTNQPKREYIL